VDGALGAVVAPGGRLVVVLRVTVDGDRVSAVDVTAEPAALARLRLAVIDDPAPGGVVTSPPAPASQK
jgi:hypothetical protein